jgi:acetyl esterase/lipase
LAPEHPFPAARDNMLECYQWLINEKKISPSKIAFGTYFDNLFKLIF